MIRKIRTRFAPSPTGWLHLGGARTALLSYLPSSFCLLRIDDTDSRRSEQLYVDDIQKQLRWLNLNFTECIYQSNRQDVYDRYFSYLVDKCYIDEGAYRLKINQPTIPTLVEWHEDGDRNFSINSSTLEDFVIRKSDGSYTYNYCSVVDDIDKSINFIVRGEDHIYNTAKQIILFNLLGCASIPKFKHLPLMLQSDGSKMSKRAVESSSIKDIREEGILPQALINYLSSSCWSQPDSIMTLDNMKRLFCVKKIRKGAAIFDKTKLQWYNKQWLRKLSLEQLKDYMDCSFIVKHDPLLEFYKTRCTTTTDLCNKVNAILQGNFTCERCPQHLIAVLNTLLVECATHEFTADRLSAICAQNDTNRKEVASFLRSILIGSTNGPSIELLWHTLGRDLFIRRISLYIR